LYGVSGIPHVEFGGTIAQVGASGDMLPTYQNDYNQLIDYDSPFELNLGFGLNGSGQLQISAQVETEDTVDDSDLHILWIITQHYSDEYFCVVREYAADDFTQLTAGQTGVYGHTFDMDPSWNMDDLTAVVLIQKLSGNHKIYQAAKTQQTDLSAAFSSNVQTGPADLRVRFDDLSVPASQITNWDWDLNGDGVVDSHEQNPIYTYTQPGTYSVSLTVYIGPDSTSSVTQTNFITVTDNSAISGRMSGTWKPDYGVYHLNGDIQVATLDSLVIEPGTQIQLGQDAQIYVQGGSIHAAGTQDNMVKFSPEDGVFWKGFRFLNSSTESMLNYCDISGVNFCPLTMENSYVALKNSRICGNSLNTMSPIEMTSCPNALFEGNFIAGNNSASASAAFNMASSNPVVKNNLIVNNTGYTAGAFSIRQTSNATLINNTVANNLCTGSAACDMFIYGASANIVNNIVWGANASEIRSLQSTVTATYNDVSSGFAGDGNIQSDLLFSTPSTVNGAEGYSLADLWTLQTGSPCIDTGDPAEEYNDTEDPAHPGQALAPAMGTVRADMGAFGGAGNAYHFVGTSDPGTVPANQTLTVKVAPNPFNPMTTISYSVPVAGKVKVAVYNVKGQLVNTLVNQEATPGDYNITWNGKDNRGSSVASGIYYLMTTAGNERYTVTKKMILLK